jgi:predicted DNA-binding ribbon-helix-helix protein
VWGVALISPGDSHEVGHSEACVVLRGHKTSVNLQEPFWQAIREIAETRGVSATSLVTEIDDNRKGSGNLSSALRVFVLTHFRSFAPQRIAPHEHERGREASIGE